VTIALTLGAQRMLRRRTLIRNLSAVETLGSVTVICSDKTGTLTENRMVVTTVQLADRTLEISANETEEDNRKLSESQDSALSFLLIGAALCNDAAIQAPLGLATATAILGDPTETALLVAARRFGLDKGKLEQALPRIGEVPFTSERKRMTTIHSLANKSLGIVGSILPLVGGENAGSLAFMKGSTEVVLGLCNWVWVNGNREPLDQTWRERLDAAHNKMAADGMRILGVAFRRVIMPPLKSQVDVVEQDLTFIGMIALIDPPRPEAVPAVATCKSAGIRPVMITGDHALTAQYVARQLGIQDKDETCLTGLQLSRMSAAELDAAVDSAQVYARVSPEDKLKIVASLQHRGQVVAMTGDGVNDAPALKKADIGVAMGITGTDVAKEAADMVLLDDNFATLVAAVEEGRVIYDNIRKFIKYILATNSGEMWVMLASPFLGMPLALLPLQILWMNLMTDGLPALALGLEPPELYTMSRSPYNPDESIFARGLGRHVVWVGLLMGFLSLGIGYTYWRMDSPRWQTMVFTTLTLSQMAHVMAIRSERQSLFRIGLLSNRFLLAAVCSVVAFQLLLVYAHIAQTVFQTTALGIWDLTVSLAAAAVIFVAVEVEKWLGRRREC
jgi:Ca2+-transporting ATPase